MSQMDTKERIVRKLRNTAEPALSASLLADEVDVSVKTINNHVDDLIDEGTIETSEIGNATAYYVPFSDLPSHKKPSHTCGRCGRDTKGIYDHAKIEYETYFDRGNSEDTVPTFYVFCRFCYSDFISWIEDPAMVGNYMSAHGWDVPFSQLKELREDPDTVSAPKLAGLSDDARTVFDYIKDREDEGELGVPRHEILEFIEEELGMYDWEARDLFDKLDRGYIYSPYSTNYITAK